MLRDELKSSVVKNEILKVIDEIDEKHAGFKGFFKSGRTNINEKTYPDFVIKQIDLSDLSFLQYVILELKKPAYDKSIYKGAVLAKALQCKKTLLTHHVSDWQKGSFAVFCGGLIFFQSWICLIGASSFLLSEYIADWRLTKKLEEELALKFNNGKIAKLDDHDAKINKFVKVGANGVQAVEKSLEYLTHIPKK